MILSLKRRRKVELKSYNFKGIKGVERLKIGSHYKYYYGKSSDYNEIEELKTIARGKGYPSAFIVAFKNNQLIPLSELLN